MEVYAELFARIDAAELRKRSNEMVDERLRGVDASLTQAMVVMRQLQTQSVSTNQEANAQHQQCTPDVHRAHQAMERAELLSSIAALQRQLHIAMTILAVPDWASSGVARVRAASVPASETETEDEEEFEFPDQVDSNQHDLLSSAEQPIGMNDPDSVYKVPQDNVDTCVVLGAQLVDPKTQRKRAMMKQLMALLLRTLNLLRSVDANMRDDMVSSTLLLDLRASLLNAVSNLDRSGKPAKVAGTPFQLLAEVIRVCGACPRFENELSRAREALAYLVENGEALVDPSNNAHRKWRMLPEECLLVPEQVSNMPPSLTRTHRVAELLAVIHKMFTIIIREHKVLEKLFRPKAKQQFKRAVALAVQCIIDNPVPSKKRGPRVKFLEKLMLAANSNTRMYAVLKE